MHIVPPSGQARDASSQAVSLIAFLYVTLGAAFLAASVTAVSTKLRLEVPSTFDLLVLGGVTVCLLLSAVCTLTRSKLLFLFATVICGTTVVLAVSIPCWQFVSGQSLPLGNWSDGLAVAGWIVFSGTVVFGLLLPFRLRGYRVAFFTRSSSTLIA